MKKKRFIVNFSFLTTRTTLCLLGEVFPLMSQYEFPRLLLLLLSSTFTRNPVQFKRNKSKNQKNIKNNSCIVLSFANLVVPEKIYVSQNYEIKYQQNLIFASQIFVLKRIPSHPEWVIFTPFWAQKSCFLCSKILHDATTLVIMF